MQKTTKKDKQSTKVRLIQKSTFPHQLGHRTYTYTEKINKNKTCLALLTKTNNFHTLNAKYYPNQYGNFEQRLLCIYKLLC